MSKEELRENFSKYLKVNNIENLISSKFEKFLNAGCLDIDCENSNEFGCSKIIFHSILSSLANDFEPHSKKSKKESKNIQLFL